MTDFLNVRKREMDCFISLPYVSHFLTDLEKNKQTNKKSSVLAVNSKVILLTSKLTTHSTMEGKSFKKRKNPISR